MLRSLLSERDRVHAAFMKRPSVERDTRELYDSSPMGRMSNRERIARAAEEARLAAEEKAAKAGEKAAKKVSGTGARRSKDVRMKVIWEVCDGTGKVIKSFPYPQKEQAEEEAQARSRSSGRTHILRPTKVPMDDAE